MDHPGPSFWDDPTSGTVRWYDDLIRDLNTCSSQRTIVGNNPYQLFLQILHALAFGYRIDVADEGIPVEERRDISKADVESGRTASIQGWEDLVRRIESHRDEPLISLYTSGTTGAPKWVAHSFSSLTRGVKRDERHRGAVWALAYHPSHIAAVHVFFQAFLNKNPIVFVFPLSGPSLFGALERRGVTHISATPTYYRQMLLSDWSPLEGVRVVSSGGEALSTDLQGRLKAMFPNARIRNIYALTEAGSLFASDGETFTVSPALKAHIRISEEGELLLHNSLLADIEDTSVGEWYHTGDMIEWAAPDAFRIVHRDTDLINVGGYTVDPHDVERRITQLDGVLDVVVRGRSNRLTGNVLEAVVVKKPDHSESDVEERIYQHARVQLPPHMVPRIIRFAESLETTRTGKKARR